MIKAEDQVCEYIHAIRLKELGVDQKSLFYWFNIDAEDNGVRVLHYSMVQPVTNLDMVSAFTVGELGKLLPSRINFEGNDYYLRMHKDSTHPRFHVGYATEDSHYLFKTYRSTDKEANARAQILILLLENNVITLDNINQRFTV